jgi:UDPglucose 6-dehydrogenase
MERILKGVGSEINFEVLSNPEFLAEGMAIKDLEYPDRVLIGSRETESGIKARDTLVEIYLTWVPREKILTSNIWSSELSKLVANAFLAQRISSINTISALCEKTEANVTEVAKAVGMDSRIGPKFLQASVGFGGSCFKKDILNLVYLCRHYGLEEVAAYWESVVRINEYQQERFILNMLQAMFNTLSGKKICLLGFAFKANTGDTRESPAIFITRRLLEEKAEIVISDPHALTNARCDMEGVEGRISYEENPYDASRGCHAIAVLTEWEQYRGLDFQNIFEGMVKPAFIFDGRNILDHQRCFDIGFNVYPVGIAPVDLFLGPFHGDNGFLSNCRHRGERHRSGCRGRTGSLLPERAGRGKKHRFGSGDEQSKQRGNSCRHCKYSGRHKVERSEENELLKFL